MSVESMALIYPMMIMYGMFTYLTYKLTTLYYTTIIDKNYDKKPQYFVIKLRLNLLNERYYEDERKIEQHITNIMYKLNSVCVYRYFDRIYLLMKKEDTGNFSFENIKNILNTLSKEEYSYIKFIELEDSNLTTINQVLKYFKNQFYRNKLIWAKDFSKVYNIPFKNKNVEQFVRKNKSVLSNVFPVYGQFYKFYNNGGVVSIKLKTFKKNEIYKKLLTVERVDPYLLNLFSPIDEHYIQKNIC